MAIRKPAKTLPKRKPVFFMIFHRFSVEFCTFFGNIYMFLVCFFVPCANVADVSPCRAFKTFRHRYGLHIPIDFWQHNELHFMFAKVIMFLYFCRIHVVATFMPGESLLGALWHQTTSFISSGSQRNSKFSTPSQRNMAVSVLLLMRTRCFNLFTHEVFMLF